jgi:hypothetical protein
MIDIRSLYSRKVRSPGTADLCEYPACLELGVGEMRYHNLAARQGIPWTLCVEHLKPKWYPGDIRAESGKYLVRW